MILGSIFVVGFYAASLQGEQPGVMLKSDPLALRPIIFELVVPRSALASLPPGNYPLDVSVTSRTSSLGPGDAYPERALNDVGVLAFVPLPPPRKAEARIASDSDLISVTVPLLCAWQGLGSGTFVFPAAGTYELEWRLRFAGQEVLAAPIRQVVEIGPPAGSDLALLEALTGEALWSELLPEDIDKFRAQKQATTVPLRRFEKFAVPLLTTMMAWATEPELRALTTEETRLAALLLPIARAEQSSAYTPYVYAYSAAPFVGESNAIYARQRALFRTGAGSVHRSAVEDAKAVTEASPAYRSAVQDLRYAFDHSDAFLKPRVAVEEARVRALAGDFKEARGILAGFPDDRNAVRVLEEVDKFERRLEE
jgi:hypothetical protein